MALNAGRSIMINKKFVLSGTLQALFRAFLYLLDAGFKEIIHVF